MKALYIKYHYKDKDSYILKNPEIQKKISFIISDKDVSIKNVKKNAFDIIIIEQKNIEKSIIQNFIINNIKTPIVIIFDESLPQERAESLLLGCDDCLNSQIDHYEFYAKISAIIRRYYGHNSSLLEIGKLKIDFEKKEIFINNIPLPLTLKEYSLMELIILKRGTLLNKEYILKKLYTNDDTPCLKIVDVLLSKIRRKIKKFNIENPFITIWGGGYRLNEKEFLVEKEYQNHQEEIYEGKSIPIQPGISILHRKEIS